MPVQSAYSQTLAPYIEGDLTRNREIADVQSTLIVDNASGVKAGRVLFNSSTGARYKRLPGSFEATYVAGGANPDFVASNSISIDVVIAGATTTLTQAFTVSHLATITALKNQIHALTGVSAVLDPADTNNRTIIVTSDFANGAASPVWLTNSSVTGGATQPTITLANTDPNPEYGPSVYEELEPDTNGDVLFKYKLAVGALRDGYIALMSDANLAVGETPYVRIVAGVGANQKVGMLTNAAGAGSDPTEAIASTMIRPFEAITADVLGEYEVIKSI